MTEHEHPPDDALARLIFDAAVQVIVVEARIAHERIREAWANVDDGESGECLGPAEW